ncbi:MAG: cytochrome c-type biogenesis protein CcmH [Proteobacteria bacterium]|nr:cytochrome c-type biogenesis protein CcmH [Pseudomonadota bacterium]
MKLNIFLLFFLITKLVFASPIYPFNTTKQEAQFNHLLTELRCLVCQNQDLANSNAGLANDLRAQVYNLVIDGKTDSEIINYLTERYGDFILFKPPLKSITAMLWFGPAIFLLLGLFIFWRTSIVNKHE